MDMPQANTEPIVADAEGRLYTVESHHKIEPRNRSVLDSAVQSLRGAIRPMYTEVFSLIRVRLAA